MADPTVAVLWFRRDLRLSDNPALVEASRAADVVVPLFVLDDRLWSPSGPNRLAFLAGCLRDLHDATGERLVIRRGPPAKAVTRVAREVGAPTVWCAEDFGPYGTTRDEEVEQALVADGIELHRVGSPYAVPPGLVLNQAGDPFKVFTPYARAWRAHGWDAPVRRPAGLAWAEGVASDALPEPPATDADLPTAGEAAARRRLAAFLDGPVHDYAERRNQPGVDGTSRLSPYLKWGCVHPRQALARLGQGDGERTFATELAWRDFYADVLHHRPETAHRAFNPAMAKMRVDGGKRAQERFDAWCAGRTGYPIVDAGMRQLEGEGWMHNRVRMLVASFLVKDLHVDWTRGARHFMHHLVDGDLASNQHGWQWTAGTGTDAAPYFRIFNPVTQGRRFDPDGAYVRRWVPELRGIDGPAVHEPWTLPADLFGAGPADYPSPVVDHVAERDEALRRYADLRR